MSSFVYIAITLFSALIIPGIRWVLMKLNDLEMQLQTKMTRLEVRELVDDRYDHLKEDMQEVKDKIDKILDRMLSQANK